MIADDVIVAIARLVLASIFLMAGWIKIREGEVFSATVRKYGVLPGLVVSPFARTLPFVEVVLGGLLFAGVYIQEAAIASLALVICFLVASGWAMHKHITMQCDCFGLLYRERVGKVTIARDLVLIAIAAAVAIAGTNRFAMSTILTESSGVPEKLMLLATLLVFALSALLAYRGGGGLPLPPRPLSQSHDHSVAGNLTLSD